MDRTLEGLRLLFSFGMPGGRSKVQKAIGRYLDGDDHALDRCPTIKAQIDRAIGLLEGEEDRKVAE